MKLEDLPEGARVLVDANILIYHFSGVSLECRAFLQRCEFREVEAFTGVHILLEVLHRLMVLEALQKGLITGGHRRASSKSSLRSSRAYVSIIRQSSRFLVCVSASKRLPQLW